MKLLFILDPLDEVKTYKDSSFAMMEEAIARGHTLYSALQDDLFCRENRVRVRATPLTLTGDAHDWYRAGVIVERDPGEFDALLMRKDPPFDMEYVYSTYLLELAETQGARVFNRPRALRDFNEKFSITRFPQFTAPTLITRSDPEIRAFHREQGEIVLKPLDGMGGASVFRLRAEEPNLGVIIETLTQFGTRTVMAQRYLPAIVQGDKRILVVNGVPAPYALARIPKQGETRGNLAAGGRGVAQPLTQRDREIAETVGAAIKNDGLLLVGLDVIGDHLTEINVTSPTCMREIHDQTGFSVAAMVLDALETAVQR
ncbi:MAG: glutathione synthase [Betaproteobacteria bacterium]|nr:glutathione synthase [Betaproteobacteria bacterium]